MEIKVIASGSSGNAYLIGDGVSQILLDCGVTVKEIQQANNYNLASIKGCLLTHSHGDHSKGIKKLTGRGVDVYLHPDTAEEIKASGHRFHTVKKNDIFEVGSFIVKAFDLVHDVTTLGFLLMSKITHERLVYITDTAYCEYFFPNLDYIMVEANHDRQRMKGNVQSGRIPSLLAERIMQTHMNIDVTLGFLKMNMSPRLKRVFLLHLSDANSDANDFRKRAAEVTGADIVVAGVEEHEKTGTF